MELVMQKAVIFDLDGVITDTAEFHYKAWKILADKVGVPFDEEANESLKGIDRMGSLRWILARGNKQLSDAQMMQLADDKNKDYQALIAQMQEDDIFPGVKELILTLKANGYLIGLASVSKNAQFVLQRLNITELFDYVADAASIVNSKPDPEIFLTVAKHLQVEPANCVGVEDAVAGIAAIKAAGMPAIGVGDPLILVEADRVVAKTGVISVDLIEQLLKAH
jgi:beta-phosphoglucomutase